MKPGDSNAVQMMFDRVASNYDFLNDLFSLGLHRVWKRRFIEMLKPHPGEKWIDLCCGTGDIAMILCHYIQPLGRVLGLDYADQPLKIARKKSLDDLYKDIIWLKKDVLKTGLPSGIFDGVLMAYGFRNLSDPKAGLKEIRRLLKPGGRAGILDFRSFDSLCIESNFQKFYLRNFVVPLASLIGLGEEYSYLEKSLQTFPSGKVQEEMAYEVGFQKACFSSIGFGQMGILLITN